MHDVFTPAELAVIDREIDRLIAEPGNAATGAKAGWIFKVATPSTLFSLWRSVSGSSVRSPRLAADAHIASFTPYKRGRRGY